MKNKSVEFEIKLVLSPELKKEVEQLNALGESYNPFQFPTLKKTGMIGGEVVYSEPMRIAEFIDEILSPVKESDIVGHVPGFLAEIEKATK